MVTRERKLAQAKTLCICILPFMHCALLRSKTPIRFFSQIRINCCANAAFVLGVCVGEHQPAEHCETSQTSREHPQSSPRFSKLLQTSPRPFDLTKGARCDSGRMAFGFFGNSLRLSSKILKFCGSLRVLRFALSERASRWLRRLQGSSRVFKGLQGVSTVSPMTP